MRSESYNNFPGKQSVQAIAQAAMLSMRSRAKRMVKFLGRARRGLATRIFHRSLASRAKLSP